jgi:hypothetical protein
MLIYLKIDFLCNYYSMCGRINKSISCECGHTVNTL